ncbi:MAG TPA: class I SAM-dependent methyltransferase [Mycobacteriales bacterium]
MNAGPGPAPAGNPTVDIESTLSYDERVNIDFVLALRRRWSGQLYRGLRTQCEAAAEGLANTPTEDLAEDRAGVRQALRRAPLYPWFSALERIEQKMLWRAASDIVLDRWADRAEPPSDLEPGGPALELDPDLVLPDYYTRHDIHVQPGGVWGSDPAAGVYQLGARIVMLRDNDNLRFHRLFTDTAVPHRAYRRIVDMGCGFGKSTRPSADAFPDAEIIGVDLSAPVLRLAHTEAIRYGLPIRYLQRDCRNTGLSAGTVGLVTGTMLLHEMPAEAIVQTLREAARLLEPGGVVRFLEFARTGDAFFDATVRDHARRNNEPFLPGLLDLDLDRAAAEAGLTNARWLPFDELHRGLVDTREPGRTQREWHFPWAVLAADKPGEPKTGGTDG